MEGPLIKVPGWGHLEVKDSPHWPLEGIQKSLPLWLPPGPVPKLHEKESLPLIHSRLGDFPLFVLTQLRTPGFSLAPCGLVLCELHFVSVTPGALLAPSSVRSSSCLVSVWEHRAFVR